MDRKQNAGAAGIAIVALLLIIASKIGVSLFSPWAVELEVASVRLSISSGDATVRNRTSLFEIGQAVVRRAVSR